MDEEAVPSLELESPAPMGNVYDKGGETDYGEFGDLHPKNIIEKEMTQEEN